MAISFVQYLDSSSAASNVVTGGAWGANPITGNSIIVGVTWSTISSTVTSVQDSILTSFTFLGRVQAQAMSFEMWWLPSVPSGGGLSIAATLGATQSGEFLKAFEISGLNGSLDGSFVTGNAASGTTISTSSITNTNLTDIIIGWARGGAINGYGAFTGPVLGSYGEYLITPFVSTYTPTWTTTLSVTHIAIAQAFKATPPAPSGGGGSVPIEYYLTRKQGFR